jgi:hypothetical protein
MCTQGAPFKKNEMQMQAQKNLGNRDVDPGGG